MNMPWPPAAVALARAVLVSGVLLGVLVLHVLTANHDAMVAADMATARPAAATELQKIPLDPTVVGDLAADRALLAVPPSPGHGDHLMIACQALLSGSLLLLGLAALRLLRVSRRFLAASGPAPALRYLVGAPLWRAPSLSKLGVLRT